MRGGFERAGGFWMRNGPARLWAATALVAAMLAPANARAGDDGYVAPRVSLGAGLGFPEVFHLYAGLWVVPYFSIDVRGFAIAGTASRVFGADGAATVHLFPRSRHGLMLQLGTARVFTDPRAERSFWPYVNVGWERRSRCWDLRIAGGVMRRQYVDDAIIDGMPVDDIHNSLIPMITVTAVRRGPAPRCSPPPLVPTGTGIRLRQ